MKINESELREIIKEVLQNEGFLDKIKAFMPSGVNKMSDPPEGAKVQAPDFTKQLKALVPGDFSKITPVEMAAILDVFADMLTYAETENIFSGEVGTKIKALNKSITDFNFQNISAKGALEPGDMPIDGRSSAELPARDQFEIVTSLNILKNPNRKKDHKKAKTDIVQLLGKNGVLSESKMANKFLFTSLNLLCEKNMLSLNGELYSFVKQSMLNEVIVESTALARDAASSVRGGGVASSATKLGKSRQKTNYLFGEKIKKMIDSLEGADSDSITKTVDALYTDLADAGFLNPKKVKFTPGDPFAYLTTDLTLDENLFGFINHLSEQNIIKFNKKQKRIINTMMLAETQLRIQKQINESIRG